MSRLHSALVAASLLGALVAGPALAGTSASSASSEGSSASVGSLSTSLETSSNSSSKGDKVAAGDYRIVAMAEAAHQPGKLALTLKAVAGHDQFVLYVPHAAAEQGRLAPGGVITATPRDYGLEFASAQTRQAFFLALDDAWHQELRTRAVTI
jgi:hypothetical protein